jgi:uncharacterized protein YndB with AHSA1/START domain
MMNVIDPTVRKSVTVHTSLEHAFKVFTERFDTWWPRGHHIGTAPLQEAVIELRQGGRCFGRSIDGTECDWGTVLVWNPPHRLVLAWQINPSWQYEPDLAKASEVEVRFTPESDNVVRVDLEHRHFERHGAGAESMRTSVDAPGGWSGLLQMFVEAAEKEIA